MNFGDMTPEQLAAMIEQAQTELVRRQNTHLLGDRLAEVQDEFRRAGILSTPPDEWVQPCEVAEAYGRGDVVPWGGVEREATAGFVVCSPDCVYHWTDHVEIPLDDAVEAAEPEPEIVATEWVGSGTITAGTYVTHNGKTYIAKTSHVAKPDWSPDVMPGLFEEV